MKILFFDTETTGLLPKDKNLKVSDFERIPRMVQLAFEVWDFDIETTEYSCEWYDSHIIKPDGFIIPPESIKVHGIDMERANLEGVSIKYALMDIFRETDPDLIVCHNYKFDMMILGGECYRTNLPFNHYRFSTRKHICTMESSKEFVGRRHYNGLPKRASLKKLYLRCTGEYLTEAHNAEHDVVATRDCFFELVKQGIIKL